jgi:hypothetical protein
MKGVCRKRRSFTDTPHLHFCAAILLLIMLFFIQLVQPVFNSGDVQAAFQYWSNRNGVADGFYWQNGGSDKGLFGNPTLVGGNVFQFSPTNFRAESIDGRSAITSDRLQFDLIADPGKEIKSIKITESGDYGILFEGKVSASGANSQKKITRREMPNDNPTGLTRALPHLGEIK